MRLSPCSFLERFLKANQHAAMLTAINDDLRRNQSSVFFIATNRFLRAFDFLARSKGSNFSSVC
jgi:hypothetical protein